MGQENPGLPHFTAAASHTRWAGMAAAVHAAAGLCARVAPPPTDLQRSCRLRVGLGSTRQHNWRRDVVHRAQGERNGAPERRAPPDRQIAHAVDPELLEVLELADDEQLEEIYALLTGTPAPPAAATVAPASSRSPPGFLSPTTCLPAHCRQLPISNPSHPCCRPVPVLSAAEEPGCGA